MVGFLFVLFLQGTILKSFNLGSLTHVLSLSLAKTGFPTSLKVILGSAYFPESIWNQVIPELNSHFI